MEIKLLRHPTEDDWREVKRRALVTVYGRGLGEEIPPPPFDWRERILMARHSPIRYLFFSFLFIGIPSNISIHFCRHVHAQPYVSSLRNDRQGEMDGDAARRDTPVNMILDLNAEELMVMMNKRLCRKSAETTREAAYAMARLAVEKCPEFKRVLIPMCAYHGGVCHEMRPCGKEPL